MNDCVCPFPFFLDHHIVLFGDSLHASETAFEEIEEELDKILAELKRQEKPGTVHMRPKSVQDMY